MLKLFIDGKHFKDSMRNCEIKEGQEFHLKLVKIDHDKLGKWDIYFESLPSKMARPGTLCKTCATYDKCDMRDAAQFCGAYQSK
jgi:hypothetical protein